MKVLQSALLLLLVPVACVSPRARSGLSPTGVDPTMGVEAAAGRRSRGAPRESAVLRAPYPPPLQEKASRAERPRREEPLALRIDPAELARRVAGAANRARRRAGVRPLSVDPALTRAARRYARELAQRQEIDHRSATPGRRTFRARIEAAGARARIAGENLARLTARADRLPAHVVRAWLRSAGHRENLLDPIFSRTGIGVWLGRDGVWYVVQYYATPR
ncbi:MAG TPA: CAP domain-containing protein [Longimicrobiales bacterium]